MVSIFVTTYFIGEFPIGLALILVYLTHSIDLWGI